MAPAYDLDDLDDEWKALLNELEDRLLQARDPSADSTIKLGQHAYAKLKQITL